MAVAGEALVDLVPAPVGGYLEIAPGGSPANVAVGLARLGVATRLLARLADDPLGRRVRTHLEKNGVELDHAVTATEQTSMAHPWGSGATAFGHDPLRPLASISHKELLHRRTTLHEDT